MMKLVAMAVALALMLGANLAQAKDKKGGGNSARIGCKENSFERCLDKCYSESGHGKGSNRKCPQHCTKKKKC